MAQTAIRIPQTLGACTRQESRFKDVGLPGRGVAFRCKTLLASCGLHDLELGRLTAKKITKLEVWDSASYMLMSCAMSGTTLVRAQSSMVEARCMSGRRSTSPRHQNHLQNHSNQG